MKRILSGMILIILVSLIIGSFVYGDESSSENSITNLTNTSHIKNVTAITEVYADGQKLSAVVVEYDKSIDTSRLSPSSFIVDGKTVTRVYANTHAAKSLEGVNGPYVIIEVSTDYENPIPQKTTTFQNNNQTSSQNDPSHGPNTTHPGIRLSVNYGGDGLSVSVTQVESIVTTNGETYSASSDAIDNVYDINLVLDDYLKPDFSDPTTGEGMKYNLYVPKDYDSNKSYPMVLFIQDEGSCGSKHADALIQGLGGVIWATPEEQAKHECFVLVPSYRDAIVNESYQTTDDLDTTVDLINYVESQYNIDKNRVYGTGQSMGSMAIIAMNLKYPDLFAGSLLIAGGWDPASMAALSQEHLLFVTSEGDSDVYSLLNNDISSLENAGAKVNRGYVNGQSNDSELESDVSNAISGDGNITYIKFSDGSVVPDGISVNSTTVHAYTWREAYSIEGLRDWLMSQGKNTGETIHSEKY